MPSLTTEVYGTPPGEPDHYWIYYIVENSQQLNLALAPGQTKPVVLMFYEKRNAPCTAMLRPFRAMALAKRNEAVFCRVDVDKFKDSVETYQVEALPTFVLIKNGREQGRVVGAKVDELNTTIKGNI